MRLVSVIIVTRNKKDLLKECLDSVFKQTYNCVEVIVVDNASSDGSARMVEKKFPGVKLILNKENMYYGRALNQGIGSARGEYVLCLNNDVVLEKDFILKLLEMPDCDEKTGMFCGKLLSPDRGRIDSAGQFLGRSRRPVDRGYGNRNIEKCSAAGFVFSPGGAAPLFSRRMLEEIKIDGMYFDESYGMFYEDLDIAWRANRFGWKAFYNPQAVAYHKRGATAGSHYSWFFLLRRYKFACLSRELQLLLLLNRYVTMLKNDNFLEGIINLPWIVGYELKLWLYIIFFRPALILEVFQHAGRVKIALIQRGRIKQRINSVYGKV